MRQATDLNTLASLAILKVDLDEGFRDYIGYLETLITSLLRHHTPDPVIVPEVAQMFEAEYGLRLPERGVQLVLRRLARRGYLKKENNLFRVVAALPQTNLQAKRDAALAAIDEVFTKLQQYASELFGVNWSVYDVRQALLGFLNIFAVDYVRAYVFRTALPAVPATLPKTQFIVGRWIGELYEAADELFEKVMILVKGQMYSNALICPDLEGLEKDFHKTTFYFDTPLVLNALGLQGKIREEAIKELSELLHRLKGKLALFQHTVDEIDGVLAYAEQNIDSAAANGRVLTHLRSEGIKRGDIAIIRGHLEEHLKNVGLSVVPTPKYIKDLQIDEAGLEEALISEIGYRGVSSSGYDVNSVRSIFVLREGTVPKRLEDCKAVFVTGNSAFAKIAFEKGKGHNSTREVSSVITDYSLANVAWLKAPLGAPNLPVKETLAACYAAMEPGPTLWNKYLAELDRLREKGNLTVDDHALLRVSGIATDELMNLTLGDESAFGAKSVSQILERVRTNLVAKQLNVLKAEQQSHASTRLVKDQLEQRTKRTEGQIYWVSQKVSKAVFILCAALGLIVLAVGSWASSILTTEWVAKNTIATGVVNALAFLVIVWAILSAFWGLPLWLLVQRFETQVRKATYARLKRWLLGD